MNKQKIIKIIWISCIYILLGIVLFLVIEYKVKWEGKDLSKYLYFYNCSDSLCTSELKPKDYYSKFKCINDQCPRIKNILSDNIVILEGVDSGAIYDYKNNNIINDNYISYDIIDDHRIVVSDGTHKGIIDYEGNVLLDLFYDDVIGTSTDYAIISNDNLWGIINITNHYNIDPKYDSITFIKDNILMVSLNNSYYFINYNEEIIDNNKYNYLYYIDNYILTISDKKINFLDKNLKNKLVMKINTTYDYNKEEERKTLNIHSDSDYIYFNVYNDNKNIMYKYSKERNTISY